MAGCVCVRSKQISRIKFSYKGYETHGHSVEVHCHSLFSLERPFDHDATNRKGLSLSSEDAKMSDLQAIKLKLLLQRRKGQTFDTKLHRLVSLSLSRNVMA